MELMKITRIVKVVVLCFCLMAFSHALVYGSTGCTLETKFQESTLRNGTTYYTDRSYQITDVPASFSGMNMIKTPNNDLSRTDSSGYLTDTMPYDGTVYVAFDSRATLLPNWMTGFKYTGEKLLTSLPTQPSLKIYRKTAFAGDCIDFGANMASGSSTTPRSNFIVLYGLGDYSGGSCTLDAKFQRSILSNGMPYYTDRSYQITDVPPSFVGIDIIKTPNNDLGRADSSEYLRFTMPYDGMVYVAFDSRATILPSWMDGYVNTGGTLLTSLSTQPSLMIYRKGYLAGECVDLGANMAPGSSPESRSNYIVLYGKCAVAVGDSITDGYEDNTPEDGKGYTPILTDLLSSHYGNLYMIENEGVPGDESIDGAIDISEILEIYPECSLFLVQYGTNDANAPPEPPSTERGRKSGWGLFPEDLGYNGSYKDYMQQIIKAITGAGKDVILAKPPITIGEWDGPSYLPEPDNNKRLNNKLKEYNMVVDELVKNNANAYAGPDFYTYFSTVDPETGNFRYMDQYINTFPDYLHLNGTGYESMAYEWFQVLIQYEDDAERVRMLIE